MFAARAAFLLWGVAFAPFALTSPAEPLSSAFAEATADESPAATDGSGNIPSAVSSTHPVQSSSGASEKIFAPHFRQILIILIIAGELLAHSPMYFVKFYRTLSSYHRN